MPSNAKFLGYLGYLFPTVITIITHFCSDLVLKSACFYLFCPAYSEQVEQFLIPAMVYSKFPFPFVELIQSLLQQTSPTPNSSKRSNVVEPSPWLLGSVIAFADKNIGKHRNTCNKNSLTVFFKVLTPLCIFLWNLASIRKIWFNALNFSISCYVKLEKKLLFYEGMLIITICSESYFSY